MAAPTEPRSQSVHEYVEELVADAPPVSDQQIETLRDAFVPATADEPPSSTTSWRAAA